MSDLFDRWASTYAKTVRDTDEENSYPFAGYEEIKKRIIAAFGVGPPGSVLDMGVGTGEITRPLYEAGHTVTGVDASMPMIQEAEKAMPRARFIHADFFSALKSLEPAAYDAVILNYAIHHLNRGNQKTLLKSLHPFLKPGGIILIGDVMRRTEAELGTLRRHYAALWDEEETYPVCEMFMDSDLERLYHFVYTEVSHCSGLIELRRIDPEVRL